MQEPTQALPRGRPRARSRAAVAARAALVYGSIGALGWLDFVTGAEIGFSLFYLIPIVASAWLLGRLPAALAAIFAAVAWSVADFALHAASHAGVSSWNGLTRLAIYMAMALLTSTVRSDRDRLKELNARLAALASREARLARTDALTGLPNGRAFREALMTELARLRRGGSPLVVGYIDVDNFKKVNDTRGHAAGDALLRRLGEALSGVTRAGDVAGRLGGDEFALLLVGTDLSGAEQAVRRFAERVAELAADYPGCDLGVSAGLVRATPDDVPADANALIARADSVMYSGKHKAKGQIVVAGSGGEGS